jgi:predicted nucleotidyltransferase
MLDQFTVLTLVTSRLEHAGIAYMVTGSVAVSLYAEPRMTRDVDLVVELQPADTSRIVEMFSAEFSCDADRIGDAIARQSMFNLIHTAAVVKVDFIVRKHSAYREEEFRRRRQVEINGVSIWVVSAEDLVVSKLDWARTSRSATLRCGPRSWTCSTGSMRCANERYIRRCRGEICGTPDATLRRRTRNDGVRDVRPGSRAGGRRHSRPASRHFRYRTSGTDFRADVRE